MVDSKEVDLRKESKVRRNLRISIPVSSILAILMIVSGVLVGTLLAEEEGDQTEQKKELNGDILNILLTSTLDRMELGDDVYLDVPLYRSISMIASTEENSTYAEEQIRERFHEGLNFLVSGYRGYVLSVDPGTGAGELIDPVRMEAGNIDPVNNTPLDRFVMETDMDSGMDLYDDLFLHLTLEIYTEVEA